MERETREATLRALARKVGTNSALFLWNGFCTSPIRFWPISLGCNRTFSILYHTADCVHVALYRLTRQNVSSPSSRPHVPLCLPKSPPVSVPLTCCLRGYRMKRRHRAAVHDALESAVCVACCRAVWSCVSVIKDGGCFIWCGSVSGYPACRRGVPACRCSCTECLLESILLRHT